MRRASNCILPVVTKIQAAGLNWLTTRLSESDAQERVGQRNHLLLRLESPTNTNLLGVDTQLVQLVERLSHPTPPWLISIEGIGGIGKTALANVVTRHMIGLPGYVDFAWVTARQSQLDLGGAIRLRHRPALTSEALVERLVAQLSQEDLTCNSLSSQRKLSWLQNRLKQQPHLLVLDNLETVEDLEILLPLLQELCNPSRFLLTSRLGLNSEPDLGHFQVRLLDEANALHLLRQEAQIRSFPQLFGASDSLLLPIFETVGGNPLALRLVVGQLEADTIDAVLDDASRARASGQSLYTHIYRWSYEKLNQVARDVWLALTLVVAPLATVEMLAHASRHDEHDVRRALHTLTRMNLVDCQGDLQRRSLHSIHSLTRTFLEKQIGKWNSPTR